MSHFLLVVIVISFNMAGYKISYIFLFFLGGKSILRKCQTAKQTT